MEDKQLNADQSLALIQQMIHQTRNKVERNAGMPFLLFGYATVVTSIAVWYAVSTTQNYYWQFLWFILTGCTVGFWLYHRRHEHTKLVTTYVDRIIGYIWIVLSIAGFLQSMLAIFFLQIPILYVITLLMGVGTALTGLVIHTRIVAWAGLFSALVLAPLCLVIKGIDAILVFGAVFLVMMVIPGHVLNYRSNHPKQ